MGESLAPMPPVAAELFDAWIAAGAPHYSDFAVSLVASGRYRIVPTARSSIGRFARFYGWQERRAAALTARAMARLEEAAIIDAGTFHRTSEILAERLDLPVAMPLDSVVKVRESVRRPTPRGGAGVSVNVDVTVTLEDVAERVAAEEGIDAADVLDEAERWLKAGR